MADVIQLAEGQDPPNQGKWIMIVASAEHTQPEVKHHARGFTLMTPLEMQKASLAHAQTIAEREAISQIYIRRLD